MSNHLHINASATDEDNLSDILRDFKKFTSKAIISNIKEVPESRREWLLNLFWYAGKNNKKIKYFKVWQDGNYAKEIHSTAFPTPPRLSATVTWGLQQLVCDERNATSTGKPF